VVDVVDIDPRVVDVGREFFRVDEYPRLNPIAMDARVFIASSDAQYDLVFGDAYNGVRSIPAHLVTEEFFGQVRDSLSDDGVYMMNIISALSGEDSALFQSMAKTLHSQFSSVDVYALYPESLDYTQNVIFVASAGPLPDRPRQSTGSPSLDNLLGTYIQPGRYRFLTAPVFTDNFNPVDYIIASNLLNSGESQ
jgi:spermidine synthase